ncbi:MAG: hypothetical protein ACOXZR_03810 [Bacilli bacterium]
MIKKVKKFLTFIFVITLFSLVFAFIDYNRTMIGKDPIFVVKGMTITSFDVTVNNKTNYNSSLMNNNTPTELPIRQFQEYKGLGYKLLVCENNCEEPVYFLFYQIKTLEFFKNKIN